MEEAWDAIHAVLPAGWYVGRPSEHPERRGWIMYAFDPTERPRVGLRSREWTAVSDRGRRRARDGALPAGDQGGTDAELGRPPLRRASRSATGGCMRPDTSGDGHGKFCI